ncbi:serpin family protein [Sorangium sp. So ce145]|uniref:serpin family protein n=1 Tax=Sorangium sp. So ce145 TaxID=3133285 RepID=UPI003F5E9695
MSALVGCSSNDGGGSGGGGPDQGEGGSGQGGGGGVVECFEKKAGCVLPSDAARIESPVVSEEDRVLLARNNASFALDLGRAIPSENGNLVYSPYSISTALAMTYAGARTTTEQAMAATMRFELPQERLHPAFNYVDLELRKRAEGSSNVEGGGFRLHTANAIWSQIDLGLEQPFLKVLGENYGARVRLADFSVPDEAESLINAWVKDQTEGMIPQLLNKNVTPETLLVLTNAIYFDAAWHTPFSESATKPGAFQRGDGTSVTAQMMHGTQPETRYGAGDGWEAVEIPYAGTPVSMFLVLPAEGNADALAESLDGAALETIIASTQSRSVDITMPKFSLDTSASLKKALVDLGMGAAFGPSADFSGLIPGGGVQIQDVIHKAVIDVDEAGTEAAAATAVLIAATGAGFFPEPAEIVLDRPFFFFISDLPTGALLFAGRVNDPTAH